MKKVIRLTESELIRVIKRVIKENNSPMRRYNDLNESDFEDEVYDDKNELIGHYSRDPERLDTARFIPNRKGEEQGLSMGARTPERSYKKPMGRSQIKTAPLKISRAEMPPMRRYNDLGENYHITNNSDFSYPEDPNNFDKFHIEDIFEVASSVREANDLIKDYYPGYYFDITFETDYGKTMALFSPDGKEIASKYIVGCCGGAGNLENLERFRRSNNDAIYNPRKRY